MSARSEDKRRAREARQAAERAAATRAARRRRLSLAGAAVLVLVIAAVALVTLPPSTGRGPDAPQLSPAPIPPQTTTDLADAVRLAGAERIAYRYAYGIDEHTDEAVAYPTNPPTNGPHAFTWTTDGNYAGLAAPPTEQVVHAQEHGRVVVQYRPGLPRHVLQQLVALYDEAPYHVLLIENATSMPCDVAATAWGQGLLCPTVNDRTWDALRAFRDTFRDRGPETVA